MENYFRVGELKVLSTWGEGTKPLPDTVCANLTGNIGWTKLTKTSKGLPVGDDSVIEVDLNEIPTSKREEEVNQEDAVEIPEYQLGDEETYGATGRVKIIPDETINEADTELMRNIRVMNANLDEDVLSDITSGNNH